MRINTNISAMNAHRQLGVNQANSSRSMERLSSGLRINRAGDDAAGLAISETMRGQIRGLSQAARNAQDGISLIQTAEGALNETHSILQRMRELAVQSASDTLINTDRTHLQAEVTALIAEVDRIATTTEFNTQPLLNGTFGDPAALPSAADRFIHIGANAAQNLEVVIGNMGSGATALNVATVNIGTRAGADSAITAVNNAINTVSTERGRLGALQNRLEHTISNLGTSAENLSAAESRIRDADIAKEMMEFTKNNILNQAATAMLAQANMAPQTVLQLLG